MTPQEKRNKKFDEKFNVFGECNPPHCQNMRWGGDLNALKSFLQSEIDLAILDYQTNFEQKHIASAVEVARADWVRKVIDQEIERKKGMRKELPQIKKLPEKYKDNIEVNPETISIAMNNVIAMNYIGHYEYGYNKAIDEDIAHLTSLKELIK